MVAATVHEGAASVSSTTTTVHESSAHSNPQHGRDRATSSFE
jgi:hypothetical protein